MKKLNARKAINPQHLNVLWIFILLLFANCLALPLYADEPKLVKVSGSTTVRCMEYYYYQNELYCSETASKSTPPEASLLQEEKFRIPFDGRPWLFAWGRKTPEVITLEYVPQGESIENWSELVTSQYFPKLDSTPKEFAIRFVANLVNSGFNPLVKFYKDTPTEVIFEFKIDFPPAQIQDEIQFVKKMPEGLYVLHYVIRALDMGELKRNTWMENFNSLKSTKETPPATKATDTPTTNKPKPGNPSAG